MLSAMPTNLRKPVRVVFGTGIALPASASGFVNAVIAVNTVTALTEFTNYATLFGEFFVKSMIVMYQPQSQYGTWPASAQTATGQPLAILQLHHSQTAPTTSALAAQNGSVKFAHSSQAWKYKWSNIEKETSTVSPVPYTGSATVTQAWCLSDSSSCAGYTGQVQFISPVTTGVGANQPLGQFLVKYEVLFRYRS
jgi:hypothetical protein